MESDIDDERLASDVARGACNPRPFRYRPFPALSRPGLADKAGGDFGPATLEAWLTMTALVPCSAMPTAIALPRPVEAAVLSNSRGAPSFHKVMLTNPEKA